MKTGERRLRRRYNLLLPMTVRRVADLPVADRTVPSRLAGFPSGLTRDISTEGIYFTIDQKLAPGQDFVFKLTVPAKLTSGTDIFICGRGMVLRTENRMEGEKACLGVAAVIEKHEIVREEPLDPDALVA